jgi:uncharacterized protein (TIGR03437 family)
MLLCALAANVHAAGTLFSTVLAGSGQEYATSVASDAQGNVYVAGLTYSPDFPVTANAYQTVFGQTCDAFIAKVGPDGKVIWATYLGGILDDWATGVAVDNSGNVWVTGWTRSANFPLVNPIQATLNDGNFAAFVAKLDPTGSKLLYSTFLGGAAASGAAGIVLDPAGDAYVAVNVNSATGYPGTQNLPGESGIFVSKLNNQGGLVYSFFHPNGSAGGIALDASGSVYVTGTTAGVYSAGASPSAQGFLSDGSSQAMVFKISPDGSKKIYENTLAGSAQAIGAAIAVDSAGEAWIAGSTSSSDFPLVKPIESSTGGRPLWKSTDDGATWAPLDNLPFAIPLLTVVDPATATTLYQTTADLGVFKSLDGGATWTAASTGLGGRNIQALAIDPVHPQVLYAAVYLAVANGGSASTVYKTVNGAASWTPIDSPAFAVSQLSVDAKNPNIVWEVGSNLRKSTDGGATWNAVAFPGPGVVAMALDPSVSGHLFATSSFILCVATCAYPFVPYLYRSVDGGATWVQVPFVYPSAPLLVDGSTSPSTVYDGLSNRSTDGGVTWTTITPPPGSSPTLLALDPGGAVYAESSLGIYVSHDYAQTWTAIASFGSPPVSVPGVASLVPAGTTGTLYDTISTVAAAGFVSKLSADGSTLEFSTYLRGHPSFAAITIFAAEPGVFETQNWISGIVLDAAGNATVAGGTRGVDFPTANSAQAANAGLADAFVTTISADGSKLNYSTYYGGSQDDGALAVGLDSQGNAILAGQTFSGDFPVPGGAQLPFSYGNAFVVKLETGPPAIAAVLNAASFQPGIEAGSWVMITGANLANTNPGRTWTAADFVGGSLPTSLDGVSVTIDGLPAFVEYISPTQINVQAPSDNTVGAVKVVVTNNGNTSAPATAQLKAAAPAFFEYYGTNYAAASRLPDWAPVGNPSVVPGTVAAKPGDTIVLWGTGFGATNPTVAAGTTVTGTPAATVAPTLTIGGMAVSPISTLLTVGSVGLYQITVQLPATLPAGAAAVQASVGGVSAPEVTIFVANP